MPRHALLAAAVHYTTWAEASGEELENTRESREAVQIIVARGAPPRCCACAQDTRTRSTERAR
jgi:hypothetical protein